MMQSSATVRAARRLAWAALALYALFLATTPFEHHDFVCHIKTAFHCASCTSTALGADTKVPPVIGRWALTDAGCAIAAPSLFTGTLLAVRSIGRSPPASV